jgi:hypothetical protein
MKDLAKLGKSADKSAHSKTELFPAAKRPTLGASGEELCEKNMKEKNMGCSAFV